MAANASKKRKQQQRQAIIRVLMLIGILIGINILASRFHAGIDLTKEKRFTLSPTTKTMLRNMEDVAVVTVYLNGDELPAVFKKLRESTIEKLETFQSYAGNHIVYRFIDPFEAGQDENTEKAITKQLADKGVLPTGINSANDKTYTQQYIYPWVVVTYKGKEMPVKLIDNDMGNISAGAINSAEALLEYKLGNAIHQLSLPERKRVAYAMGNGELLNVQTIDMLTTLEKYYKVDTIDLQAGTHISPFIDVVIINKPTVPFEDKVKFKIDQYVMNGGSVLWAIDNLNTPMDSLMKTQQFLAFDYGLQLDDILFKYGVRINSNLIEDMQCTTIPLVNNSNEKAQVFFNPWIYFPLYTPTSDHPIVNNMDAIMGIFTNSIDTIATPDVKKTILLTSSKYSRTTPAPVRINLGMLRYRPRPEMFNHPYQPVAVLLEGKFTSLFKNRVYPEMLRKLDSLHLSFKESSVENGKMVVIGDGDFFTNDFNQRTGPMEMGYWQYGEQPERFANKSFFLNCVEYLADDNALIEARSKDIVLRTLDIDRVKKEVVIWQTLNVAVPIVLVLIFASVYFFFRKRKYEAKAA